jgi:hypothetical protein
LGLSFFVDTPQDVNAQLTAQFAEQQEYLKSDHLLSPLKRAMLVANLGLRRRPFVQTGLADLHRIAPVL